MIIFKIVLWFQKSGRMARLRKKTDLYQIVHGMNFQKCAKMRLRIENCEKKRESRAVKKNKKVIKKAKVKKTKKKV